MIKLKKARHGPFFILLTALSNLVKFDIRMYTAAEEMRQR